MIRSLRFRISALVTAAFAIILVSSAMLFINWFETGLESEARADDAEELDRQEEILRVFERAVAIDPTLWSSANTVNYESGLVALIPDDGTFITISDAQGVRITDSAETLRLLTDPESEGVNSEAGEAPTTENGDGAPPDDQGEGRLAPTDSDLSNADTEALDEIGDRLTDLIFGPGSRSAVTEGRLITTTRELVVAGRELTISAESRVASIDSAVSVVTTVLWIAIPAILLLVAGMAYLAASRALQPVEAITGQVTRIRSAQTRERVPVSDGSDEIHRLATTMNEMLDRIEAASLNQRRFVSDASHELRTPASVIRAEMEAALADPGNDWRATAESVLAEQERLSNLVDDLLLLTMMDESGTPTRREIDLDDIVRQEAERSWSIPVSTRQVEPVRVHGDPKQLSRVVQNLLANANRHATTRVDVALSRENGQAVLLVDDDGDGVPARYRARIFQRFARLDEARDRDVGGSGLGLAIVAEVAQSHGGAALVNESPTGGARFEIRIATDSSLDAGEQPTL